MKTTKLIFILLLLLSMSCQPRKEDRLINHKIRKILIQLYPTFLHPSIILVDMENDEVIFQRISSKTPYYTKKGVHHAPYAMNIKLNDQDHKFIENSEFENIDFVDHPGRVEDGYNTNILFTFDDGDCKDVELVMFHTPNQKKLVRHITKILYENQTDSISKDYLKRLFEQFNY